MIDFDNQACRLAADAVFQPAIERASLEKARSALEQVDQFMWRDKGLLVHFPGSSLKDLADALQVVVLPDGSFRALAAEVVADAA